MINLCEADVVLEVDDDEEVSRLMAAISEHMGLCDRKATVESGREDRESLKSLQVSNNIVGGYCRTLAGMVKEKTGLMIDPNSSLFAWLIRHCSTLATIRHVQMARGQPRCS